MGTNNEVHNGEIARRDYDGAWFDVETGIAVSDQLGRVVCDAWPQPHKYQPATCANPRPYHLFH